MKYFLIKFKVFKIIILFAFLPFISFAQTDNRVCSPKGYTVITINGVFTDKDGAIKNRDKLKDLLDDTFNSQPLTVDYLHNPSHLAGIGDLAKVVYQKIFDNETVVDYDLVEMLKDASEKVKTQKFLLVAHSQGNFYANSFYDTVVGKNGGVPTESIGVYSVATPASRVAGGGKWLTSDTDKVIADIVGSMPFKKIMTPNTSIVLAEDDDSNGHNFSGVYLKYRGSQIVSDIQSSLDKLQTNSIQNESLPCIAPPELTLAHKMEGAILSVVDPAANTGKDAIVVLASGVYKAGNALAKSAYSLTSFIAGAASVLAEDEKPPIKTYSLWVGSKENTNSADNSQPATLTEGTASSRQPLDIAEESLQNMQNQILVLQKPAPSRAVLDGAGLPALSAEQAGNEISQPKFVATNYPGFGGGGTGIAESSSSASLPAGEAGSSSSTSESSSSSSSSISSSASSSSSSSDTSPPAISSLAISECQQSLSSDGCLVATTTLNISWNSTAADLAYFVYNQNGTYGTTTATSTTALAPDNAVFSLAVSARDLTGNFSATSTQTAEISTMPVVINEVAWAGNSADYSADEWIELYNRTNKSVNLSDWILYSATNFSPYTILSGTIASKNYYLLERTNNDTVSDITADKIYTGDLVNSGENIVLIYKPAGQSTTTIDEIPYYPNWRGGSSFTYYSMERYNPDIAGTESSNWGTNNTVIRNGQNAGGGNINGTPKARNSANYLINRGQNVSSNLTLYASNSPYLVNNTIQIFNASSTLTIEPGVVIKFYNDAGLSFGNGAKISAAGSSANPIIFTSFYDDTYGGDTNGNFNTASPTFGDWFGLRINSPGTESTISHAVFRYGGKYYNGGGWSDSKANLYIANSSAAISDSIFEYSKVYGLNMFYSNSSVTDSIFRNNNNISDIAGYDSSLLAIGGSPSLLRNSFASNHKKGAYFFNSSATVNSNTFTSNANEAIYSYGPLGSYSGNSGSGNGVNAISLSGTITQNGATTTLAANSLPYLLNGNVIVAASSTLAINAGIIIKGWNNVSTSYLNIYGNLIVSGVNFSDIIFSSMYNSPTKGSWGGLRLYSGSQSSISGATFEYANTAIAYTGSPLNLSNIKFNENNLGVSADAASLAYPINASGITFTSNTATTSPGGLW